MTSVSDWLGIIQESNFIYTTASGVAQLFGLYLLWENMTHIKCKRAGWWSLVLIAIARHIVKRSALTSAAEKNKPYHECCHFYSQDLCIPNKCVTFESEISQDTQFILHQHSPLGTLLSRCPEDSPSHILVIPPTLRKSSFENFSDDGFLLVLVTSSCFS